MPHISKNLIQAYQARDTAAELLASVKYSPASLQEKSRMLCDLVRAWDTASERIRVIRGRPLPGSLRPEKKKVVRVRKVGMVDALPEQSVSTSTSDSVTNDSNRNTQSDGPSESSADQQMQCTREKSAESAEPAQPAQPE
jgi:hypothetical protein